MFVFREIALDEKKQKKYFVRFYLGQNMHPGMIQREKNRQFVEPLVHHNNLSGRNRAATTETMTTTDMEMLDDDVTKPTILKKKKFTKFANKCRNFWEIKNSK